MPTIDLDKPLLQVGSWYLVTKKKVLRRWPKFKANSIIAHTCSKPSSMHKEEYDSILTYSQCALKTDRCIYCNEEMPIEMRQTWVLHNFDYIISLCC